MHPTIPLLLELQKTDKEIASLRANLDTAPKRIREADAKLSGARAAVASAKDALAQIVAVRRKTEFEVAEWRERAKKFRGQTAAVKTNEAYKALLHEIANAEMEISKAEDTQLDQMMAAEEAEKNVKSAEVALRESEQTIAAERKEIENHAREVNRKMLTDISARERIAAQVPEEILTCTRAPRNVTTAWHSPKPSANSAAAAGCACFRIPTRKFAAQKARKFTPVKRAGASSTRRNRPRLPCPVQIRR